MKNYSRVYYTFYWCDNFLRLPEVPHGKATFHINCFAQAVSIVNDFPNESWCEAGGA